MWSSQRSTCNLTQLDSVKTKEAESSFAEKVLAQFHLLGNGYQKLGILFGSKQLTVAVAINCSLCVNCVVYLHSYVPLAGCCFVCVCPPPFLGVLLLVYIAGGCPTPEERASNKGALQDVLISARTLADVPATETFDHAVPLLDFAFMIFHGGSARYTPKQVSFNSFLQTVAAVMIPQMCTNIY